MASPLITGRDFAKSVLLLIGAIASGETPTASETSDVLSRANEMIDAWATQALTALVNERHVFAPVANQQAYLLSPTSASSDWVVDNRPDLLTNVGLLLNTASPAVEIPRGILTDDEWAATSIKDLANTLFTSVYYNPTSPAGTVSLWPIPTTAANDVVLYFDSILVQFADLTTQYRFPAGYLRTLRYNVAVDIAPEFGAQLSPVVDRTAAASLRTLKAANVKMSELSVDPALSGRRFGYNYYTDGYN